MIQGCKTLNDQFENAESKTAYISELLKNDPVGDEFIFIEHFACDQL